MEATTNPVTPRRTSSARHGTDQRSAVTNGRRLHVIRPGDTAWSRRFRDILNQIVGDLGGADLLSEGQRQLARRCATISIQCEKMEGVAAAGAEINIDAYGTLTDRLGRCFQRLGLKRQARDVGMTLGDLMRLDIEERRQEEAVRAASEAANVVDGEVAAGDQTLISDVPTAVAGHHNEEANE